MEKQFNVKLNNELINDIKLLALESNQSISDLVHNLLITSIVIDENPDLIKSFDDISTLKLTYIHELFQRGRDNVRN